MPWNSLDFKIVELSRVLIDFAEVMRFEAFCCHSVFYMVNLFFDRECIDLVEVTTPLSSFKTKLVVIQPTPFCNINCRYCYLPNRQSTARISLDTIAKIAERFFQSPFVSDSIRFLWHAGEPLSLSPDFYNEAFSVIEEANLNRVKVIHSFQTNGTLITPKWCEFLAAHQINIGLSLDGPQWIHNSNRLDRSGEGTFDRVMRSIELLRKHNIKISIIMVLTAKALEVPDEIWSFFIKNGIYDISFNPEEAEGANKISSIHSQDLVHQYQKFLVRIAELREQSELPVKVRELDNFTSRIKYGSGNIYSLLNNPFSIFNFDCDGNFSTYCPELLTARSERFGSFALGNVNADTLESALKSEKFHALYQEVENGKERCLSECDFFEVCGGGNPSNKFSENGSFNSTETMNCKFTVQANCQAVLSFLEQKMQIA
jgi:uncharacterized protein